jgi:lipopolysaccharide assembly outer membrane protein LptD (OstA)
MTGERLVYNLDTKKGKIKESYTMLDKAYYRGEVVRKVDEDVLLVDCGRYIPCEYEDANFYFWSSKMKIINGDKVIAKPIVLYIEGLPVFYAPFFVFSIKKGRHSGFLPFRIGSWAKGGRYVDNLGYYWAISDYWDLETSMYIREDIGVAFNGKANYKKRYVMNGTIKGSYARDANTTFSGRSISHRWSLNLNHSHTLSPTASISGNGSFVSDKSYTTDISNDQDERLNRNLRSQLNFSKRWENSSLTAVIQSTKDLDRESSSTTLPNLTYRLNSRNLFSPPEDADESEARWYNNIRVSYNSNFKNIRSKAKVDSVFSRREYAKATHNTTVKSPQSILKYVTVSPSINHIENWFQIQPTDQTEGTDTTTDKILRSWTSSMSVSANTKLYGHFFPPIPGLVGIRHSMTPSMSFSYTPKSENNAGEAKFVGASFSSSASKSMRVSLSNLFQMKYRSGDEERKLDLFTVTTGASYNFKAEQRKWSTVSTSLRSSTIPLLNDVTVAATHDLYNPVTGELDLLKARLTNLSVSTGFSMSGSAGGSRPTELDDLDRSFPAQSAASPWNMTVRYRYGETRRAAAGDISKSITHWITADARFNLTESFGVAFSQNYDIRRKVIVNRSIRVTRDMRCWEAQFSWNPNGSLEGYYFRIFLRQLPDVKVEKSQSPLRGTLYD